MIPSFKEQVKNDTGPAYLDITVRDLIQKLKPVDLTVKDLLKKLNKKNMLITELLEVVIQEINYFEINTEIKYPEGDKLFAGYNNGSLLEFSMVEKKTVHDFGQIFDNAIVSLAKTYDNKSQFVCANDGGFQELDISTRKQVSNFNVKNARCCIVTYNNRFLITAEDNLNCNLTKWSIRAKKQLNTWKSDVDEQVDSQSCSQDNKYQLIGYNDGFLTIFHLQKHQTLKNIKALSNNIYSIAFSRDNKSAFISDYYGNIKKINWLAGASSDNEFDFTEEPKQVGTCYTWSICLTKDEKYLLVGSNQLVCVFETKIKEVTKEFKLTHTVKGINLIRNYKKALITERNGNLSIIDLETLEISSIDKNITKDTGLTRIVLV